MGSTYQDVKKYLVEQYLGEEEDEPREIVPNTAYAHKIGTLPNWGVSVSGLLPLKPLSVWEKTAQFFQGSGVRKLCTLFFKGGSPVGGILIQGQNPAVVKINAQKLGNPKVLDYVKQTADSAIICLNRVITGPKDEKYKQLTTYEKNMIAAMTEALSGAELTAPIRVYVWMPSAVLMVKDKNVSYIPVKKNQDQDQKPSHGNDQGRGEEEPPKE